MKGYLTTCDGAQFELPTLLKWEFSYTGSVPCDSFTLRCAYEPAMAETLRRAVRFTAREDGTVEFAGVVDECGVTCDEKGLQLEVSGRGMAALLLDNEAESVSYQWATMEEILKNHVTPYGIVCLGVISKSSGLPISLAFPHDDFMITSGDVLLCLRANLRQCSNGLFV